MARKKHFVKIVIMLKYLLKRVIYILVVIKLIQKKNGGVVMNIAESSLPVEVSTQLHNILESMKNKYYGDALQFCENFALIMYTANVLPHEFKRLFEGIAYQNNDSHFVNFLTDLVIEASKVENVPASLKDNFKLTIESPDILYEICILVYALSIKRKFDIQNPGVKIESLVMDYLLSEVFQTQSNGEFFTPYCLVDLMTELLGVEQGYMEVCDPACGSGGFLLSCYRKMQQEKKLLTNFYGYDINERMLRICYFNLVFHAAPSHNLYVKDILQNEGKFTCIISNPPYLKKNYEDFISKILTMIKPKGKCAILVPEGFLTAFDKKRTELRNNLVKNFNIEGIISLPAGVFAPYTMANSSILFFTNELPQSDTIPFYQLKHVGYTLDYRREPTTENDIPELVKLWKDNKLRIENKENPHLLHVEREKIIQNNFELSALSYFQYEETTYDSIDPRSIMSELVELETKVNEQLQVIGECLEK